MLGCMKLRPSSDVLESLLDEGVRTGGSKKVVFRQDIILPSKIPEHVHQQRFGEVATESGSGREEEVGGSVGRIRVGFIAPPPSPPLI
jgi:hypothetical protein